MLTKLSPLEMLLYIFRSLIASCFMLIVVLILPFTKDLYMQCVYVIFAFITYFSILFIFPIERKLMLNFRNFIRR